jgi:hypothetical protein
LKIITTRLHQEMLEYEQQISNVFKLQEPYGITITDAIRAIAESVSPDLEVLAVLT